MKRALFIDLSIPLNQDSVFLSRYGTFLKSVFRSIYKTSKIKYFISLPLEVYDLLNKEAFLQIRAEMSKLFQEDRLSVVLKPNYELAYTKLSTDTIYYDSSMSEHLMAYLYGEKKSFEGDNALVINNFTYFYMNKNDINEVCLETLSNLGFSYLLSDINSPLKTSGTKILPVNSSISILFSSVISTDVVSSFIVDSSASDYEIWKLNPLDVFLIDEKVAIINIENLLYVLDKNSDIVWTLVDEIEDIIKYSSMDSELPKEEFGIEVSTKLTPIQKIQKSLSSYFISQDSSKLEDALWSAPFFIRTSFQEIDEINRFNYLLLVLLSGSIKEDNLYSNPHFVKYTLSRVEELVELGTRVSSSEFVSLLKEFNNQINKIVFN